jgi:predicted HicB family RNase H-like nuclease
MEGKMPKKTENAREGRMIHVRLSPEVHKRLRIRTAETDTSIQDWVAAVVIKELEDQERERSANQMTIR